MSRCVRLQRKHRQPCIGDLDTMIKLQDRAQIEPIFGDVDFDEAFTDTGEVWAMVETVNGKTFFDGVGTEVPITHEIVINYDASVTNETWVVLNGRRLDILTFEDLDERGEFMLLTCTDRGSNTFEATKV